MTLYQEAQISATSRVEILSWSKTEYLADNRERKYGIERIDHKRRG